MPYDLGLVPNVINSLANRVGGLADRRARHQEAMGNLDLANAKLDYNMAGLAGEQQVRKAKVERRKYLDEPVTLGQAIQTSKLPDKAKAELLGQMPEEMANFPTTRQKAFDAFQSVMMKQKEAQDKAAKQASDIEQKRLDRQNKLDAARIRTQGKPEDQLKGLKLKAWKDYLEGNATPRQSRLIGVDKDEYLGKAIELIKNDDTMYGKSIDEVAKRATEVAKGLRERAAQGPQETQDAPQDKGKVIRTGTYNGKKVVQYEDGTIDYLGPMQ